jgi:hypothetical protein
MSKKMMLLALAVASMAMFALPSAASATPDHIDGITNFTGTIHNGGSLVANEEPTIRCSHGHVTGSLEAGGTTGTISLDFTGCKAAFLFPCHTAGALSETIKSSGTFHVITYENKPAVLVTPVTTKITCPGVGNEVHVEGNGVIGTITSPACNVNSNNMTIQFSATGPTQNHRTYTGVNYELKVKTLPSGHQTPAGLNATATLTSIDPGKVTCT